MNAAAMTSTAPRAGAARPRLLGLPGLRTMLRIETRLWLRDAGTVFFGLAFPTVLLLGMGLAIPGMQDRITDAPAESVWFGVSVIALMVPAILAVAAATPALNIIPVTIATQREKGLLRRLATTPMRPQGIFLTSYLINLAATVLSGVVAVTLAMIVFDIPAPRNTAVVVLGFTLGLASMFAVGTLIAARAPRGTTASAFGTALYFPMMLFAGLWTPGPAMPDWLATVSRFVPLGASAQAMTTGWFEGGFPLVQTLVMLGWVGVLIPLSIKYFRWS